MIPASIPLWTLVVSTALYPYPLPAGISHGEAVVLQRGAPSRSVCERMARPYRDGGYDTRCLRAPARQGAADVHEVPEAQLARRSEQ